jgi:hypothetical protein
MHLEYIPEALVARQRHRQHSAPRQFYCHCAYLSCPNGNNIAHTLDPTRAIAGPCRWIQEWSRGGATIVPRCN